MRKIIAGIFGVIIVTGGAFGLSRVDVSFTTQPYLDKQQNLHLELNLTEFYNQKVRRVRVFYREVSEAGFRVEQMHSEGFRYLARVDLSGIDGNVVEYYFEIDFADGVHEAYPEGAPTVNLLQTSMQEELQRDKNIIIISPEPGEAIFTDEIVITVSYPEYSPQIDKDRTKMFLDTWDVSGYLQVFDEFLTFAPRQVPAGEHKITLELYNQSGKLIAKTVWSFTAFQRKIVTPRKAGEVEVGGQFFTETRQEVFFDGDLSKNYTYAGLNVDASYRQWAFGGRVFISNQEEGTLQPINRYMAYGQITFWNNRFFKLTGGDAYPQLNRFLVSNIFVRGFYAQMYLKFFNVDIAAGRTQRAVQPEITGVDTSGIFPDTAVTAGAYKRNMLAIRTSFGSGRTFQWGLLALKSKDEVNSLNYTPATTPEENVAVGTDLFLAVPDRHLVLEGTFAASLYNPNIQGGSIPFEKLKDISTSGLGDEDKKYYDFVTRFITVNEFLILRPNLAYEGRLRFRRFGNTLTAVYQSVDDNFVSLGQPFFLRDQRGFLITDDLQIYKNQLYLTGGFRWFKNNLAHNKPDTTTTTNIFVTLSYYPLRNLPSLSVGFNTHRRSNGLTTDKGGVVLPVDNRTNTINFSTSYAFYTGQLNHNLSLNLANLTINDNTPQQSPYNFGGNLSNTVTVNLRSKFAFPLKTNLEFSFQQTESARGMPTEAQLSFNSLGAGGDYSFRSAFSPGDALILSGFGRFGTLSSEVAGITATPDYDRVFLNGRIVYRFPQYGRITLNGDYISYSGSLNYADYILSARVDVNF